MINRIFVYDNVNNKIELNTPEILLIKEFAALMCPDRNKCKEDPEGYFGLRAFREFTYIWLAISWESIYSEYDEQEKHTEALKDSGLTDEEFNDPQFRAACRKYQDIQNSNRSIKMLHSAQAMVDKFIDYFETADPLERDVTTGKPIYKVKDIQAELKNLTEIHDTLIQLESQVKKHLEANSSYRGNAVEDFDPGEF